MDEKIECPQCKSEMELTGTRIVANTQYKVLRCRKCNYQVARRKD